MFVEISTGELFDKVSILEIKLKKIQNLDQIKNIQKEFDSLNLLVVETVEKFGDKLHNLYLKLFSVNNDLWKIEDRIRELEKEKLFDKEFISVARSVYIKNDLRAKIKREINDLTNSNFVEEKSYSDYNS